MFSFHLHTTVAVPLSSKYTFMKILSLLALGNSRIQLKTGEYYYILRILYYPSVLLPF